MVSTNAGMKIVKLALAALAGAGAGCAALPSASPVAMSELPNCFASNYDAQGRLFTIKNLDEIWANPTKNPANQQCLLTVGASGGPASVSQLSAGSYTVYLANGGGGGAGGTMQSPIHGVAGGGGGGGGAGAKEMQVRVYLTEGLYKLTIGAGGPGGGVCAPASNLAGGTGWAGSPSNVVRVATGEVVAGAAGADAYARPTLYQNEKLAVKGREGQGGSGPGQSSGGAGARPESAYAYSAPAEAGASTLEPVQAGVGNALAYISKYASQPTGAGGPSDAGSVAKQRGQTSSRADLPTTRGSPGSNDTPEAGTETVYTGKLRTDVVVSGFTSDKAGAGGAPGHSYGTGSHPSGGGGGGATDVGAGGSGGGETLRHGDQPPVRGALGSGGGGGKGSISKCDAGARGGHGYIAFRRN